MIGRKLGNWVLEQELGQGAMGRVYLAREELAMPLQDHPGGRRAAVKVLAAELATEAGFRTRFQREIEVLRGLDHPNIVRYLDSGAEEGIHYFAMEYVEGPNYDTLLREHGRLPWQEVLELALQICPALRHAHDRGVVHRDIKPPNLLRGPEGRVKLTDFGIAKVFAEANLTRTGGVIGTAEYLSPEQAQGKPATRRSDLYSLGVVLYTLLTGRTPFRSASIPDLLRLHCYGQFDPPRKLVPDIPYEIDETVCVLLEKDPIQRPADAQVLHKLLDAIRKRIEYRTYGTLTGGMTERPAEGEATEPGESAAGAERKSPKPPGPATLMSRLMREELDRQNRGGPVTRFFNQTAVVAVLFVVCVGLLTWALWPASAASLHERGAVLLKSDDPDDWETAWREYYEPLEQRFPGHPYGEEAAEARRRADGAQAQREARRAARQVRSTGEAQWFYQQGLRLRQQGRDAEARRVWSGVVGAFAGVPAERGWVELSRKALGEAPPLAGEGRWAAVREALALARQLAREGQRERAEEVWRGVEALYGDDPSAVGVLEEVRRDRGPAE